MLIDMNPQGLAAAAEAAAAAIQESNEAARNLLDAEDVNSWPVLQEARIEALSKTPADRRVLLLLSLLKP